MRKLLGLVFVIALFGTAFGQEVKQPKFSVGFDMPTYAWVTANENGDVLSVLGVNAGLGISYRSYFQPLAPQSGSAYWEAGTILLLDPYIGGGYDYRMSDSIYAGLGLDIFPVHAFMWGGYGLYLTFIPNLHVGFYLF